MIDTELDYVLKKVEQGIKSVRHIPGEERFSSQIGYLRFIFDGMIEDLQHYSNSSLKVYEETVKSVKKQGVTKHRPYKVSGEG